jgi:hypothetical protein
MLGDEQRIFMYYFFAKVSMIRAPLHAGPAFHRKVRPCTKNYQYNDVPPSSLKKRESERNIGCRRSRQYMHCVQPEKGGWGETGINHHG